MLLLRAQGLTDTQRQATAPNAKDSSEFLHDRQERKVDQRLKRCCGRGCSCRLSLQNPLPWLPWLPRVQSACWLRHSRLLCPWHGLGSSSRSRALMRARSAMMVAHTMRAGHDAGEAHGP